MPSIPMSQGPRLREQALQGGFQNNIDVSSGTRAMAGALGQVGQVVDQQAKQQAEIQAWNAQDAIYRQYRDWLTNEQKASQGEKAAGFTERVDAWWEQAKKDHTEALSPLAQQLVGRGLGAIRKSAYDNATAYQTQQLDIASNAAFTAGISALGQSAISAAPDMREAMVQEGIKTIQARAAEKGVNADPDILKFTTGVHTNVLNALVQDNPAKAREYYLNHRDQIDATRHDEINRTIERATVATEGAAAATEVWRANGPKSYAEPIASDRLMADIDKRFANDPERRKAAHAALKEQIAAFNQAQTEHTTAATNSVYQLMQQGVSINQLKRMPEWGTLVALNAKAAEGIEYQAEQRALHRAQTGDALEGIELKRLQRGQALLTIKNWDVYANMQDPEVLARTPRAQVQALAATIGQENAERLLKQKDKLSTPEAVHEAKADKDQLDVFLRGALGADVVNKKNKSDADIAVIDLVTKRVNDALAEAQAGSKVPLLREQKDAIMQRELNRVLTVPPTMLNRMTFGIVGTPEQQVPAITLTPERIASMPIPQDVRTRAATLMKQAYGRATTDAQRQRFAPSDANLRRFVADNYDVFFKAPTDGQ